MCRGRCGAALAHTGSSHMALIPALLMSAAVITGSAASPVPAVAAGMAAYHRGDFTTALAILKPIVYDVSDNRAPWSDPWATAYLAQMFRRGEGTAPAIVCTVQLCVGLYASMCGVIRVNAGLVGSARFHSWKMASRRSVYLNFRQK